MNKFQVAFIPIGVPTYHMESADKAFRDSKDMIQKIEADCMFPDSVLLSIEQVKAYIDTLNPDIIILQNTTFANAAYASEVLKNHDCPILLWTLREPVIDGGRLRLNSLTGAYSAGNALMSFRNGNFEYIFGNPNEEKVIRKISAVIRAARMRMELKELNIAAIGYTPQGFGFGRALDVDVMNVFGSNLISIEARELMDRARRYTDGDCVEEEKESYENTVGLENTPEKNRIDHIKLYRAYKEFIKENHIGAFASRCWPDFFVDYGTPVCSVLAMLNDMGVAGSCEADVYGAMSMFLGMKLSGHPVFFGDPVSMNEKENTITYWHCGTAACSLAREDKGAQVGVHPNRKIGPTMEFGCKPCDEVTIFRIGQDADKKFRFLIASGEALDKEKQFLGTSIVVKTENSAQDIVYRTIKEGWEPHYVIIYKDVKEELETLGNMLGIEVHLY